MPIRDDITPQRFTDEFMRLKRGSVTRRHFLGVTGLGLATAILEGRRAMAGALAEPGDLGRRMTLATWANYHDPETFASFTRATGVEVEVILFSSNEEMLAKLEAVDIGWDLFVPTNYTISTYVERGLIDPVDLSKVPNFMAGAESRRFTSEGTIDGRAYALPKNWGTTGMAFNSAEMTSPITSWKDFFAVAAAEGAGRTIVHDQQLTTVGSALVALGYDFNATEPDRLAEAEALLLGVKPHLYAITSDYQPGMRSGEAWMTMCWTNDGAQLNRDMPEIRFALGRDGGEIWTDFYAIPSKAANKRAGYALLNHMMDPATAVKEHIANGTPATDARVVAMLPAEVTSNKIVYPDEAALTPLEFGTAVTLTDPIRAEVMARFRSA